MTYANVHDVFFAAPAAKDLPGRIRCALTKKATQQVGSGNKTERKMCQAVEEGSYPDTWTLVVLGVLDAAGNLPAKASITDTLPTDANVDTATNTAWGLFLSGRELVT